MIERMWRLLALALVLAGCRPEVPHVHLPCASAPVDLHGTPVHGLANIQRTMRLLETSSATRPNPVRILFYGQSITASPWSRAVEQRLRERYPHARLEVQHRALGGFAADRLVSTAESDLYPFQPDLIVLHVYGAHDAYRQLVERVRQRTSAELMVQTDHPLTRAQLELPRDACASPADAAHWDAFMNYTFLPSLGERHRVAVCDVRAGFRARLLDQGRAPESLLRDGLHLNGEGDRWMASVVESCLRASGEPSPAERWTTVLEAQHLPVVDGVVQLPFEGHGVEALLNDGEGALEVRIDGVPPSRIPGLYGFARAHAEGAGPWPPLHGLTPAAPLLLETFTFTLRREGTAYAFRVRGSRSGEEGEGRTDAPFTSRSGRLALSPANWDIDYAFSLAGRQPPDTFSVELRVAPHFADRVLGGERASQRMPVALASGLPGGAHQLELRGQLTLLRALRIRSAPR